MIMLHMQSESKMKYREYITVNDKYPLSYNFSIVSTEIFRHEIPKQHEIIA